jgi:hypothetical protein
MIEAVGTSETSVNFYQTTRRKIPEDSHFQIYITFGKNARIWKLRAHYARYVQHNTKGTVLIFVTEEASCLCLIRSVDDGEKYLRLQFNVDERCLKMHYILNDLHGMAVILSCIKIGNLVLDTSSPVWSHFIEDLECAILNLASLNRSHSVQ